MSTSIMQGYCISLGVLKGICPREVAAIEKHPAFTDWGRIFDLVDDEEDTMFFEYDDDVRDAETWQSINEEISSLWANLAQAFFKATNGATLSLLYIDEARCDDLDDVPDNEDGCIFDVDGVFETTVTPAGSSIHEHVSRFLYLQRE